MKLGFGLERDDHEQALGLIYHRAYELDASSSRASRGVLPGIRASNEATISVATIRGARRAGKRRLRRRKVIRGAAVDFLVKVFFSGVSDAGGGRFHFIFYFFQGLQL